MRHLILLLALTVTGCGAHAQDMASVLARSLKVYSEKGADAYIEAVLKGGPMEGSKDALSKANMLRTVESYYGSYQSFDVVQEVKAGLQARLVYYVLNYEHGPLFGQATGFKRGNTWSIVNFKFHTEAQQIWPDSLLTGK